MNSEQYGREVGQRLREVRVRKRLSLTMVAERSGTVSAEALGSYERAERAVLVEKLADLAGFYGVPVVDLLPDVA
jgi:transcriptional regulator with XRE-family HTH domain